MRRQFGALLVTTAAAAVVSAACGDVANAPTQANQKTDPPRPTLVITPAVDTVAVDSTAYFGQPDSTRSLSWSVDDTTIAQIIHQDGRGVALRARRVGTATITGTRGDSTGTATLVVLASYRTAVTIVFTNGGGVTRVRAGDTAGIGVFVYDKHMRPLFDRVITVTLSDSSVAQRIDPQNPYNVWFVGLKDGTTTVTVSVEGISDCAQLLVADSLPDVPPLCPARRPVASGVLLFSGWATDGRTPGDSFTVNAWLYDARHFLLSNRQATWSVDDTTIVQVRPVKSEESILPHAVLYSRRTGTTTLVALSEGVRITQSITVR
jgi:hypothetical protein